MYIYIGDLFGSYIFSTPLAHVACLGHNFLHLVHRNAGTPLCVLAVLDLLSMAATMGDTDL